MAIHIHGDLPRNLDLGKSIAIDTETMGLNPLQPAVSRTIIIRRWRCASCQNCSPSADAPHLKALLADPKRGKLFHFAPFDLFILERNIDGLRVTFVVQKLLQKVPTN